ncbi:MAG: RAMP superfamily CRISPR-associated protein, partial [Campylobacteraceae bacterium]|nr:RAMP superfamily CRISPR-associated protein [Campylobacteraceae bacterium]
MKRYVAHITIEADTPLKVGSNATDFLQDSPVQKDWNGLPMILGTSIAGVLRKDFDGDVREIFGEDNGSKVIFSNALLLNEDGKVSEGLLLDKSKFLKIFDNLPIREHTAITDKGVAKEYGKFDEEVVFKGTRFKFSIEVMEDKEVFDRLIGLLQSPTFRLGGGSSKGFGKFKIVEIKTDEYDENTYHNYSSSLNHTLSKKYETAPCQSNRYTTYTLKIKPDDFFMFGSGFGDDDADMTPVYERVVDYDAGGLSEEMMLIPASSIKGAISHRIAYHYNKSIGKTLESGNAKIGEDNEAVRAIFGHKKEAWKDQDGHDVELGQKGK